MIELKDISKSYGEKRVLHRVSLAVPEGKISAWMAPSGWGKTTLLRILLGLELPDSGEILGMEQQRCSAVFQEDRLLERLSAEENLRFVTREREKNPGGLLAAMGLAGENGPVSAFSGGMKRRTAIARALAAPFDVLALDEPFRGLDEECRQKTIETVLQYSLGKTVILITHDRNEAFAMDAEIMELPLL